MTTILSYSFAQYYTHTCTFYLVDRLPVHNMCEQIGLFVRSGNARVYSARNIILAMGTYPSGVGNYLAIICWHCAAALLTIIPIHGSFDNWLRDLFIHIAGSLCHIKHTI